MVGNSVRSDIAPVLELGARGVHVPYPVTWALETAEAPARHAGFRTIERIGDLPELLATLDDASVER